MLYKLFKQLMLECNLKQTDLVEILGCSLSRVKAITSGRVKNLTREENEALIDKLGLRADWLLSGFGPMFQDDEDDNETQDEFVNRQQSIKRMAALAKAMPMREITRTRLSLLMTGSAEDDGPVIYEAVAKEAAGIDFVTGKPIDGATPRTQSPSPDEQLLLDTYRRCTPQARANLIQTAVLLSAGMALPDQAKRSPRSQKATSGENAAAGADAGSHAVSAKVSKSIFGIAIGSANRKKE